VSRLGERFLAFISRYPRSAAVLFYVRHPGVFAAKAVRRLARLRRDRICRAVLDEGRVVCEVDAAAGADLISIVTPVWRVAEEHLRAAIASVRAQSYPHWELLLGNDASPDPHVRRVLDEAARGDRRIRVEHFSDNLGIAAASDRLVARAGTRFVAFLDHDDLLHPRALELVARFLTANPDVDWVFTDQDKVDERGRHREPCLKPGWSHHLLLAFNYVTHLRVVRRSLLALLGGHRSGLDGAQDYDLALRAQGAGARFAHLPGVLYHWRAVAGSMARAASDKPVAHERALRALADHAAGFPAGGRVSAEVLLAPASFFRVRRAAAPDLRIAAIQRGGAGPPADVCARIEEVTTLAADADEHAVVAAVRRSVAPVVALLPERGLPPEDLEELLALLQVSGTAVAAPRLVDGHRVTASGWWACAGGGVTDPWAGLRLSEPGYLNLGLVPGPRLLPPRAAWVAWKEPFLAAWNAAGDVPTPWRLAVGCARAGLEVVTTPAASLPGSPEPPPPLPVPGDLPVHASRWLRELALVRCQGAR
jgi:hypothetical protein